MMPGLVADKGEIRNISLDLILLIESQLLRIKDHYGIEGLQTRSELYSIFLDICPAEKLERINAGIATNFDLKNFLTSSVILKLVKKVQKPRDRMLLLHKSAKDLSKDLGIGRKDAMELCLIFARVVTENLAFSSSFSRPLSPPPRPASIPSDFIFVPKDEIENKSDAFYICNHPVTQGEFEEVMGFNPSQFKGNPNNPVEMVSWMDALEYCNRRSIEEGRKPCYYVKKDLDKGDGYRLLGIYEWCFAARGGTWFNMNLYAGSSDRDEVANYYPNPFKRPTYPVMQKKPNEIGIYDMNGNVWEWCQDLGRFDTQRLCCGGFYNAGAFGGIAEIGSLLQSPKSTRASGIGFRVCLDVPV